MILLENGMFEIVSNMGITINSHTYNDQELIAGIICPDPWMQELVLFLQEWLNDEPFVVGYTSGSTGTPKRIELLKKDMMASAKVTNDFFGLNQNSNLLLCLSTTYIAGKMMVVRAICAQANLIVVKPSSHPFQNTRIPIDLAAVVPMQLLDVLPDQLTSVKALLIGGAPISDVLGNEIKRLPSACYATYGMTETVSHIALRKLNGRGASDSFFALGDVRFDTDDRNCLKIMAPHLSEQVFITNDLVNLLDCWHFQWLGRFDNIINSGGIKISPEQIEAKLSSYIQNRFFITSEPDLRLGEKIILIIEGEDWHTQELDLLCRHIDQVLEKYEHPKNIYFKKNFIETYSGKIVRLR